MNRALYRAMFKRQWKKTLSYAAGLSFYNLLLIGVYPAISQSKAIKQVSLSLPDSVKRVFGLTSGGELARFESYVSAQCFGQVWLMVMAIYSISTADQLMAKPISQGTMAYLLSSPVGRRDVLSTQVEVLASGLALLLFLTELGIWAETTIFSIPIDVKRFDQLTRLSFALFLTVGAYSLFFSALFEKEGYAGLSAAGLTAFYYAMDVLAGLDRQFSWVSDLTILSWFRPQEVLDGKGPGLRVSGLLGLSAIFIGLTGYVFNRKEIQG